MTADDDARRLRALARAWSDAIVANDAAAVGRYLTDDWVLVDADGVGTRGHFLGLIASGDLTHEAMDVVEGTERVRFHGDTALHTARVTSTARYRGEVTHADEWTTDVYVRTADGGWRCAHSHVTPAAVAGRTAGSGAASDG